LLILGIDSSDDYLSAGVSSDDKIIISKSSEPRAQNKNALHAFLLSTLEDARLGFADLNGVAVAIGPGSFTGLRVGLAEAKGLCWAGGMPLVGISSLIAIAYCCPMQSNRILAIKDARRDEFYYGGYSRLNGYLEQTIPDTIGNAEDILSINKDGYVIIGPGISAFCKYPGAPDIGYGDGYDRDLIGGTIANLGAGRLRAGKVLDLATSIPNYIRTPKPREWKP